MKNSVYIIVPCYNEEECLPDSAKRLEAKLEELIKCGLASEKSRIVFVDDGSADATWDIICRLHDASPLFCGIKLTANAGHQNAVMAGLLYSRGRADAAISIDADLQDDINAMDDMLDAFRNGFDIVYGVRTDRTSDSFLKRFTAESYYKTIRLLGGKIVYNHADYRLLSARAVSQLSKFPERGLFLRGLVPMLGLKACCVGYARSERTLGESKYTPFKMLTLAMDGITSLTTKPLFVLMCTGALIALLSAVSLIVFIVASVCGMASGPFWMLFSSVWLFGGALLAAVGLAGEYAGKALMETKARPRFFVDLVLDDKESRGNLSGNNTEQQM